MRTSMIVLGGGLAALWLGAMTVDAHGILPWLALMTALASVAVGLSPIDTNTRRAGIRPLLFTFWLGILALFGNWEHSPRWVMGVILFFACAYFAVAMMTAMFWATTTPPHPADQ
jgi:hypothetical protein